MFPGEFNDSKLSVVQVLSDFSKTIFKKSSSRVRFSVKNRCKFENRIFIVNLRQSRIQKLQRNLYQILKIKMTENFWEGVP